MLPDVRKSDLFMPTYEAIVSTEAVLKGAIQHIPEEHRTDLADLPEDKQIDFLRSNLAVRTHRNTNVLELQYTSRDSAAAVAVLNAVIDAYVDFLDRTQENMDAGVTGVLEKERASIEKRLRDKQEELQEMEGPGATRTSQAELREKNLQLARSAAALEEALLESRQKLPRLLQHYGEKHPEVQRVKRQIQAIELMLQAKESNQALTVIREKDAAEIQLLEAQIESLRATYDMILERIKDIDLRDERADLRVSVLSRARVGPRREEPSSWTEKSQAALIQSGDVLEIALTTKHSTSGVTVWVRVADDGSADIPLVGSVQLGGTSLPEAARAVTKTCADRDVLPDAQVELKLKR
jgi:uncharacterized protein involved in exopolysaccharide biosynthesis